MLVAMMRVIMLASVTFVAGQGILRHVTEPNWRKRQDLNLREGF